MDKDKEKHDISLTDIYASILDCISEAVFLHDAKTGTCIDVNQTMIEMFRCPDKETALGFTIDRFSLGKPPFSIKEAEELIRKAATEGPQTFTWHSRRYDGTLFWSEVSLTPLSTQGRELVVAVVRDITSRLEKEQEIDTHRARYIALFEHIPNGVAVYKAVEKNGETDFIILEVNRSVETFEKVKREEIIGRSVQEVFPGIKEFGLFDVFLRVWRTGQTEHYPVAFYKDDRISGWRDNMVYRLPSGEIVAIYEDKSEQKQISYALMQKENLLKAILDAVPAAICLVDARTRTFVWISPYIKEITGYEASELIGQTPRIFYDTEEEYQRVGQAYHLFKTQNLVTEEAVFRHRKGHLINIFLKAIKMDDKVLVFIVDITDRKKAEQEKADMERQMFHVQKLESLGVLAGGIAHDFNNLLMGIMGNAELLGMMVPNSPELLQLAANIIKTANKAADLCKHMLAYSGKGKLVTTNIDLSATVTEMLSMLNVSLTKHIELRCELAQELPLISGDDSQISQVIMNLVINAAEAIEQDGGTVTIKTGVQECTSDDLKESYMDWEPQPGTYVFLEVSDTGCGMDDTIINRLFDPFFTTKFTGRGLGMAAVLGIVRGHNGCIKIDSTPGQGTAIRVLFPISKEMEQTEETPSLPLPQDSKMKLTGAVMLVDDEQSLLDIGKNMLEIMGFSVITAQNGAEAIEKFKRYHQLIRCVILDLTMPRMDGKSVLLKLKDIAPDVKVIMCSGYDTENIKTSCEKLGASAYLQKPYQLYDLQQAITSVLGETG
jgi:PAS domain S-box-containing protein